MSERVVQLLQKFFKVKTLKILATSALFCTFNITDAKAGQWYTGSLVSPSGTTGEGVLNVEPYYSYSQPMGAFGPHGGTGPAKHPLQRSLSNSTLWKYGITPDLSIQFHTMVNYRWKHAAGHAHGPKAADMPLGLIYRFVRPDPERYIPALSIIASMAFPTGDYSNLGHEQDGVGTGTYIFRLGFVSQSTYTLPGQHELRVRVWNWFRRSVSSARLKNMTSYGTDYGFYGRGHPGMSGQTGISLEYGLNQKWVLATDLAHDWANGSHIKGYDSRGHYVNKISSASSDWQIAPAIEYNWNPRWGIIVGSAFYFAGHNSNIQVTPQFAVNSMF